MASGSLTHSKFSKFDPFGCMGVWSMAATGYYTEIIHYYIMVTSNSNNVFLYVIGFQLVSKTILDVKIVLLLMINI